MTRVASTSSLALPLCSPSRSHSPPSLWLILHPVPGNLFCCTTASPSADTPPCYVGHSTMVGVSRGSGCLRCSSLFRSSQDHFLFVGVGAFAAADSAVHLGFQDAGLITPAFAGCLVIIPLI